MSLRNTPNRDNTKNIADRIEINQEKPCKLRSCDAHRYGFTGYCSSHGSRYSDYGDPYQKPLRISDDYLLYYRATLKYIEEHQEELADHLSLAETLIRHPDLIAYHDVLDLQRWNPPTDYRDKGLPLGYKVREILMRWRKDTRFPKHFLASVIAPHVMTYQEPEVLLGGRPVHMMITRSLLSQCRAECVHELLPYDYEIKKIQVKKTCYTNKVGARDRANLGHRLTSMFTKVITKVYKEVSVVVDEGAKEYREKLDHYKMLEKMYKSGDHRITRGELERARVSLGV